MAHSIGAQLCEKLLNGRIGSHLESIQYFASGRIDRWTVIDEQDAQHRRVCTLPDIQAVEVELSITADAGEAFWFDPFES